MKELAIELNNILKDSCVYDLLGKKGKNMYFPKGIVAQSAEAGEKAKRYNATVGLAQEKGEPFCLSSRKCWPFFVKGTVWLLRALVDWQGQSETCSPSLMN